MDERLHILLIDDDPDDRTLISRELKKADALIRITEVGSLEEFEKALVEWDFDVVITDYDLQWSDGLEVFRTIRERFPDSPVIMVTGTANEDTAKKAKKSGLDDYIIKSIHQYRNLPESIRRVTGAAG